jgi:competence protein ComEC
VGQGDGILMRTPKGFDIIIDGGPKENSMTNCLEHHLPFWDRTIEAVFLTHPDADHLTGLIGVVKSYNISFFGTSEAPKDTAVYDELFSLLKEDGIPVHWVFKGDILKTKDNVTLLTYWPTKAFVSLQSKETNDYSLVQMVRYGKFNALLTGDIPSTYLNSIMPQLSYLDVFKPPHHGSKTGIDEFTFQHIVPKFAVLSFGLHNRYHHPAPSTIEILNKYKIPTKNTLKGDVEIVSNGKEWEVKN